MCVINFHPISLIAANTVVVFHVLAELARNDTKKYCLIHVSTINNHQPNKCRNAKTYQKEDERNYPSFILLMRNYNTAASVRRTLMEAVLLFATAAADQSKKKRGNDVVTD